MHRLAFIGGSEKQPLTKSLLSGLVLSNGRALPMTEPLLSRISRRDNAQKFLAAFGQRWKELSSISLSTKDTWLALDRIRDPGNLGTIMRTADATGVTGIILKLVIARILFSVRSVRASMGAVFNVDLINCSEMMF